MRWMGHVARIWERRGVYRNLVGKPEGKGPIGDPGLDERIILRWIVYYIPTYAQISTINLY